ncbi:hypothetical protein JTE90_019487 [Oedothorax gibbosus]|uniref:C2H2-type domain-containing protein n=1 Tax=Oedothorax gibbosus TaxID=931172 RepID=A0AAV6UKC2_9ARAC|nr:hypothetical protein JTE90_019487 [Oedothorax gibbosus]
MDDFTARDNLSRFAEAEGLLMCSFCTFTTQSAGNLKIHERNHTFKNGFVCKYCQKECKTKGNLKTHLRVHTGKMAFECRVCRKGFHENQGLVCHFMDQEEASTIVAYNKNEDSFVPCVRSISL